MEGSTDRQVETIAVMAERSDERAMRRTIEDKFGDTSGIEEGRNEKGEQNGKE